MTRGAGISCAILADASGLAWDGAKLRAFIRSPRDVIAFLGQFQPDSAKSAQETADAASE